ncbi:MAG: nitroreductase family protein [Agathobacter sp.]
MEILEVMKSRHSVRQYTDKKIESDKRSVLNELARECNSESGMNIQIIYDEPKCFDSFMAHYGKFSGCKNYIAVVGKKSKDLDKKAGYYGEKLVLKAQELGLNTCWVAMTHGKSAAKINKGEKLAIIISLGYGENQGVAHKSKRLSEVCSQIEGIPTWFAEGMEAVMLAPTAMNQQKFKFILNGDKVKAIATGGFYSEINLGIVKYHFEAASGHKVN